MNLTSKEIEELQTQVEEAKEAYDIANEEMKVALSDARPVIPGGTRDTVYNTKKKFEEKAKDYKEKMESFNKLAEEIMP